MLEAKRIYEQLETCTDDEKRLDLLFDLTVSLLSFDDKRSLETADEILELANRIDSNKGRSYYHSARARVFYKKSLFAEATHEFNLALDKAMLTSLPILQAICLDSLGVIYNQQRESYKAIDASYKALEIFKTQPNTLRYQAIGYNNIGNAYKRLAKFKEAEDAYLLGLEIAVQDNDERTKANILNNLGAINLEQENFKGALKYVPQALQSFKNVKHKHGEVHSTVFMGHALVGVGEYAKAMDYYLVALKLLKQTDHKPVEIHAYKGVADVYMKMDAFQEAVKYYKKALKLSIDIEDYNEVSDMYLSLASAYQALGLKKEAIKAVEQGIEAAKKDIGEDSKLPKLLLKQKELE